MARRMARCASALGLWSWRRRAGARRRAPAWPRCSARSLLTSATRTGSTSALRSPSCRRTLCTCCCSYRPRTSRRSARHSRTCPACPRARAAPRWPVTSSSQSSGFTGRCAGRRAPSIRLCCRKTFWRAVAPLCGSLLPRRATFTSGSVLHSALTTRETRVEEWAQQSRPRPEMRRSWRSSAGSTGCRARWRPCRKRVARDEGGR
mmetsp:Transcript_132321/g.423363  ORF Transcript_132321/g.423363 Transcript_132321/m.423363 type:complete len:205 (-) Transcript_132321:179-793(-)